MRSESAIGLSEHDELSEEELAEVQQQRRERLRDALDEHQRELSAENADRLANLAQGLDRTEQVEVNGQTFTVRAWTSASVEDTIDTISEADSMAEVREEIVEVIVWFIEDPDYGFMRSADEVTRASQRENALILWGTFAEEYGMANLFDVFETVSAPAINRLHNAGDAQKFRS